MSSIDSNLMSEFSDLSLLFLLFVFIKVLFYKRLNNAYTVLLTLLIFSLYYFQKNTDIESFANIPKKKKPLITKKPIRPIIKRSVSKPVAKPIRTVTQPIRTVIQPIRTVTQPIRIVTQPIVRTTVQPIQPIQTTQPTQLLQSDDNVSQDTIDDAELEQELKDLNDKLDALLSNLITDDTLENYTNETDFPTLIKSSTDKMVSELNDLREELRVTNKLYSTADGSWKKQP